MLKEITNTWRDYVSMIFSQVLSFPFSLFYSLMSAKLMGSTGYGVFNLFMAIYQLVFFLGFNWLTNSTIRFAKEEFVKDGNLRKTFTAKLFIVIFCFCIVCPVLYFFKAKILSYTTLNESSFWLLPVILLVYMLADQCGSALQSIGLMRHYTFSVTFRQLTLLILVLCVVLKIIPNRASIFIGFEIISYIVVTIYSLIFIKIRYLFPLKYDFGQLKKVIQYSWPLIITSAAAYISSWVNIYIIKYFLSVSDVGIYQFGYKIAFYFSNIIMAVTTLTFPLFVSLRSRDKEKALFNALERIMPQLSFLWALFISLIILCSGVIFKPVFSGAYADSGIIFKIILAGISFQAIGAVSTSVLCAFDYLKYELLNAIIVALVSLSVSIFLVPFLGISGAAIAILASFLVSSILYVYVITRVSRIRLYGALFGPLFCTFVLFAGFLIKSNFMHLLILPFVLLFLFFWSRKINIFTKTDLSLLEKINIPSSFRNKIARIYSLLD